MSERPYAQAAVVSVGSNPASFFARDITLHRNAGWRNTAGPVMHLDRSVRNDHRTRLKLFLCMAHICRLFTCLLTTWLCLNAQPDARPRPKARAGMDGR